MLKLAVRALLVLLSILSLAGSTRASNLGDHISRKYGMSKPDAELVVDLATQNDQGLPTELVLGVIAAESGFRPKVVSSGNAIGLMQVIAYWHKEKLGAIGGKQGLYTIKGNIHVGTRVLKEYINREKGNVVRGLLRYNGSLHDKSQSYAKKVMAKVAEMRNASGS